MTEAEWLACDDLVPMLEFLRGKASDRKLRLFAVACCRSWPIDTQPPGADVPTAIDLAECWADGDAQAGQALQLLFASHTAQRHTPTGALGLARTGAEAAQEFHAARQFDKGPRLAALLRDIVGPLPRLANQRMNRSCFNFNSSEIARAIYEERAFDRLPILADALEEAGCTDAEMLNHCRQPGGHLRGCWVVDLALGKK